jgi:Fe-S oxidoreductase
MPNVHDIMPTPKIKPDASVDQVCHRSKEVHQKPLGLPWELGPNWKEDFLNAMDDYRGRFRSFQDYLDICVRCGACTDKCHYFLGTGDPKNMPVARAELLRSVYRRYRTLSGKVLGKMGLGHLVNARELTEDVLEELYRYLYQCSLCRRCSVFCPYGIDTAEITYGGREILNQVGYSTKYITEVLNKVYSIGNNLGIPEKAWKGNSAFMEEDMEDTYGLSNIKFPVNDKDADILLVPPSADLFVNTETMAGYGLFFHATGESWTTSTYASEAGNFGLFFGYAYMRKANKRIVDLALKWDVDKIICGECGHAWRHIRNFTDTMNECGIEIVHILEHVWDTIQKGKLKFDTSRNKDYKVTYHDPCNVARASGLLDEPRNILKTVLPKGNFIEMPSDMIRERTFCCGGGGGLLTGEIMDLRMNGGKPRALAVKHTGANRLAVPCAICKANFGYSLKHWETGAEQSGVMDYVGYALVPYLTDEPGVLK